jgi:hypothetical protein
LIVLTGRPTATEIDHDLKSILVVFIKLRRMMWYILFDQAETV